MKAVKICPKSSKNLYIKGATMYKNFIAKEKDASKKLLLVDTLMWIYDQRIVNYGQKGNVLGRKGVDLARYDNSKTKEAYDMLAESFELQGNKSQKAAITTYYQLAEKLVKSKELETTVLFDLFPKLQSVVVYNTQNSKSEADKSKWVQVAAILEQIFSKYAGCEE